MTAKDNWERRMEILEGYQQFFESWLKISESMSSDWVSEQFEQSLTDNEVPDGLARYLGQQSHNPWLFMKAYSVIFRRQIEFNKTVIEMLTDLDHRKSEPVP